MKLYITRHGQVGSNAEYIGGNATLPRGEMPLSPLGRDQATLLGKYLVQQNFHGTILSSPFWRTMETAELIAAETGSAILPTPWIHEIMGDWDWTRVYQGTPLEKLRQWYPHIAADAVLESPWWAVKTETGADVDKRVGAGLDSLINQYRDADEAFLLVGHGASIGAVYRCLNLDDGGFLWNCSLGLYDTKDPRRNFSKDVSFLPIHMITNNKVFATDVSFYENQSTT